MRDWDEDREEAEFRRGQKAGIEHCISRVNFFLQEFRADQAEHGPSITIDLLYKTLELYKADLEGKLKAMML